MTFFQINFVVIYFFSCYLFVRQHWLCQLCRLILLNNVGSKGTSNEMNEAKKRVFVANGWPNTRSTFEANNLCFDEIEFALKTTQKICMTCYYWTLNTMGRCEWSGILRTGFSAHGYSHFNELIIIFPLAFVRFRCSNMFVFLDTAGHIDSYVRTVRRSMYVYVWWKFGK